MPKNNKTITASAGNGTISEILLSDYNTRTDGKLFSGKQLATLYDTIAGTSNNTYSKIAKLADGGIYASDKLGASLVVTFGGLEWYAVAMSKVDQSQNDGSATDGDVVLTLWLKDAQGDSSRYSDGWYNSDSYAWDTPANMYGSSMVRAKALNIGGQYTAVDGTNWQVSQSQVTLINQAQQTGHKYSEFTLSTSKLYNYIVAPQNINYQETETYGDYVSSSGTGQSGDTSTALPNDAYGSVTGYKSSRDYSTKPLGSVWKADKIWLPSLTEVGTGNGTNGVWKCYSSQRSHAAGGGISWQHIRTGQSVDANRAYYLDASGNFTSQDSGANNFVRPALHLNLKKADSAAENTEVPIPQNVTVNYDGSAKWLDTLTADWIDTALHNNTNVVKVSKIEYTGKDVLGADITPSTDVTAKGTANILAAGKYEITLNISTTQNDYTWRGGTKGDKKFTITINQTSVPYTLEIQKGGSSVTSVDYKDAFTHKFTQTAVNASLLANVYELVYTGTGSTTYAASTTAPTDAGSYSFAVRAKEDTANAGKKVASNYKLTSSNPTVNFTIKPKELTPPTSPAKQGYDGGTKTFTVNGYDSTVMTAGSVDNSNGFVATLPTGLTAGTGNTFTATDAGKYTVAFRLPLDSADGLSNRNYVWTGTTDSFVTVDIEIEKRVIEVNWDLLAGQTNWTVPVTAEGLLSYNQNGIADANKAVSGEELKLQYRFYYTSDGASTASTPADALDIKNIHDKNGASSRPQGSYTIELVIADNSLSPNGVDGKNYSLGNSTKLEVTLGAGKADVTQLIKKVKIGSALPADLDGLTLEYTIADGTEAVVAQVFLIEWATTVDYYTYGSEFGGQAYKYEKYVNGSWVAASDTNGAGKYRVTVSLEIAGGKDYTFDATKQGTVYSNGVTLVSVAADELSATLSFEVEIAKKTIDASKFTLQYSYNKTDWFAFATADNKVEFVDRTIYVRVNPDTLKPKAAGITVKFGSADYADGKSKNSYNPTATFTLTDNDNFTISGRQFAWKITNKQINVDTFADWEAVDYTIDGVEYAGEVLGIKGHSLYYPNVIEYEYSWYPESDSSAVQTGSGETALKTILTTASDTNKLKVTVTVKLKAGVTSYDLTGSMLTSAEFTVGSDKTPVTAATAEKVTYGDITGAAGFGVTVSKADGTPVAESDELGEIYSIYIYRFDGISADSTVATGTGVLLKDYDYTTLDAGKYVIEVRLSESARDSYSLKGGKSVFKIERKQVAVPTVKEIIFNGGNIDLADYLEGFDGNVMELDGLYGTLSGIKAGTYSAVIRIKEELKHNYIFVESAGGAVTAKFVLTDGGASTAITDDGATATFDWTIAPYVLDAESLWNLKGKNGASLAMPQQFAELLNNSELLSVNYSYSETRGGTPLESAELKGGKTYYVGATLDGEYKDCFVFKDSGTQTTAPVAYTVPQSGASAFFGNALSFVKSNWLWFVIALAVLLFLIILICIIRHRKKTKEERLAKKEAEREKKEEEKRRKEEDKQRKEEEREAEKRKREQELELEKAKQEAELAKMKAQMGLAGAGAGMAAMAMAQQPQQQMPYQAPAQAQPPMQQQPYPQMQPQYDSSVLAEIKAELAEIKARQNMASQQQMPMPNYGGGNSDTGMMALMQAQLAEMRADHKSELAEMRAGQSAAMKTEFEIMKMKLDQRNEGTTLQQHGGQYTGVKPDSAEAFGAVLASMVRNLAAGNGAEPKVAELPPVTEESKPVSVAYPPDAVVTTTTTVDTTKNGSPKRSREDDLRALDIDGFYDTFEENK